MSRLPFTTDDVREQCAQFGDAPLAHPLPVRDLLKMCDRLDELEIEVANLTMHDAAVEWRKAEARAEAAEAERDRLLLDWSTRGPGEHVCHDWKVRAEAAEVRIAKAVKILRQFGFTDTEMALRVLTEDAA